MWHRNLLRALDEQGTPRNRPAWALLASLHGLYALGLAVAAGALLAFFQKDRTLASSLLPATAVLGLLAGGLLLWTVSPQGPRPTLRTISHAHFLFMTFALPLAAALSLLLLGAACFLLGLLFHPLLYGLLLLPLLFPAIAALAALRLAWGWLSLLRGRAVGALRTAADLEGAEGTAA